jgi:hypothetical protein
VCFLAPLNFYYLLAPGKVLHTLASAAVLWVLVLALFWVFLTLILAAARCNQTTLWRRELKRAVVSASQRVLRTYLSWSPSCFRGGA